MSGGQRQRVALGRAIVRNPSVFLLDEPLSNLDAKLRVEMRAEIIRLQKTLETTLCYVTHDQVEAMSMADRIAIINKGRIPISHKNVQKIPWNKDITTYESLVTEHSTAADLVIMGFSIKKLTEEQGAFFKAFKDIKDILFVRAGQKIIISDVAE